MAIMIMMVVTITRSDTNGKMQRQHIYVLHRFVVTKFWQINKVHTTKEVGVCDAVVVVMCKKNFRINRTQDCFT